MSALRRQLTTGCLTLLSIGWSLQLQAAELNARVDWQQPVTLSTPVSGVIEMIDAEPGQAVSSGQVLLRLDPRPFRLKVDKAQARLKGLESVLAEAKREYERAEELYDRTVLSDHELQLANNAFVSAEADYLTAKAELGEARLQLEYSEVRAPFKGVVLTRHVAVGETVVSQMQAVPLITLADSEHLLARFTLSADQAGSVSLGQRVQVVLPGGPLEGRVRAIDAEAQGSGRSVAVSFMPPAGEPVAVGQRVTVILP